LPGQTIYNVCFAPQLAYLTVHIVDANLGTPIGGSEVVSPSGFTQQETGVFSAFFNTGNVPLSVDVRVNGGEFYGGNNVSQFSPFLFPGLNSMTFALTPAASLGNQGDGAGGFRFGFNCAWCRGPSGIITETGPEH